METGDMLWAKLTWRLLMVEETGGKPRRHRERGSLHREACGSWASTPWAYCSVCVYKFGFGLFRCSHLS